jgi:murein L,D-transpeptidase YafK
MQRFRYKKVFIGFAVILVLTGVFIFVLAQKEGLKSLSEVKNPRLVVKKKARLLQIYDDGELIKTYQVALGRTPRGDKRTEGDGKTPEGEFYVFTKNEQSKFYLSLGLSYPNREAAERGWREKIISREEYDEILKAIAEKRMPPQKTALGGEIYIHGGGIETDWTEGCVALPDEEIKEFFAAVPIGATVIIEP